MVSEFCLFILELLEYDDESHPWEATEDKLAKIR